MAVENVGAWAGWLKYDDKEPDDFHSVIGPSYGRVEGPGRATVGVDTRPVHRNSNGSFHGGYLAALADHFGFAALNVLGRSEQLTGVTIDLQVQFIGAGVVGQPLFGDVEILKETGRLFFIRMTFRQGDMLIAAATATLKKVVART